MQREDRNHIWGYVARNLTRPIWLSSEKQKADVVVGNPPWLRLNALHKDIVNHAKKIKLIAQNVELDSSWGFIKARQQIKKAIRQRGQIWKQINQMVEELLEKEKLHQIPA